MAFKSVDEYNNDRYKGMFILQNNRDYADVVFLYQSKKDVLVADTHYIRSGEYNGYVHCCGRGCPACAKNIRVQPKLFIPMYVISHNGSDVNKIQFFDRSIRFDAQLQNDVFANFPNPSEYVFRITRHGESRDVNTTYHIQMIGRNTIMDYDEILNKFNIKMPDYFETICKEFSAAELDSMLNVNTESSDYSYSDIPEYQVSARKTLNKDDEDDDNQPSIPEDIVDTSEDDDDLGDDVDF